MVAAAPVNVIVDDPVLSVEPAPEVSQFPLTVHVPVVMTKLPEVPPVIRTFETDTTEAFAARLPPFPRLMLPPLRANPPVAKVVVEDGSLMERTPPHRSPFEVRVNVTGPPEEEVKVTFPPNSGARVAKAMLALDADVNVIGAAKDQEPEVETFVHEPVTVHEPVAREVTKAPALLTATLPVIATVEPFVRRIAPGPLKVRPFPSVMP
jgi:hypothetical protein